MRTSSKIIAVILALVLVLSIGGVAASWIFAGDDATVTPASDTLTVGVTDNFSWNSNKAIDNILDALNDSTSEVYNNFWGRIEGNGNWIKYGQHSFYGSMDNSTKYTLTEDLGLEDDWSFIVRTADEDYTDEDFLEMEIYLICTKLQDDDGNATIPIGEYVYRVYKTWLKRDSTSSDWYINTDDGYGTQLGYARMCWYLDDSMGTQYSDQIPSIEVTTWQAGILGYSSGTKTATKNGQSYDIDVAVRTFNGDTPSAYDNSFGTGADNEKTYYSTHSGSAFYYLLETTGNSYRFRYTNSNTQPGFTYYDLSGTTGTGVQYTYNAIGTYTITCDVVDAAITVFTSGGDIPTTQSVDNGVLSVVFEAGDTATKYYIRVDSGGETANLSVNKTGD